MSDSKNSHGASMIEKSKRKKIIDDVHSKNYDAGAVDLDERQLHRTGIRGRKIFVIVFILMLLLLLFLANLVILLIIYYVDNIGIKGMESVSFFKNGKTKWFQDGDFSYIYPRDDIIGGFDNENIDIKGDAQNVFIQGGTAGNKYPSITVGPSGADIQIKKSFSFADSVSGKQILHLDQNTLIRKEGSFIGDTLKANSIRTPRVVSDDTADLNLKGKEINVKGSEGLYMDSKDYLLQTNGDISLTINDAKSSLIMKSGVILDRSKMRDTSSESHMVLNAHRYRLCACGNNGRLFRVRIVDGKDYSCATASSDPCA